MLYLSQLPGTPVEEQSHARLGKIIDVLLPATQVGQPEPVYPSALLVEGEEEQPWRVPPDAVTWQDYTLHLLVPKTGLTLQPEEPTGQEIYLVRDVLDKQEIDIQHKKTVRVNDVCLADDWQILGIDNSTVGLIRRLTPAWLFKSKQQNTPAFIPWSQIELIGPSSPAQHTPEGPTEASPPSTMRTPSGHLAELHPADIAEIVHQLTAGQGARLIEGLDDETAADTMEEIDIDRQRNILENIQPERAADILQAMGPDEAADLLARLPEERASQLLHLMTPEESEDVQELLEYAADTAGGLMTTDYIVLNQHRTATDALDAVRQNIQDKDVRIAYIYCVADETQDECQVLGVVSLWDLLVAQPTQSLQELMETDVISVEPETDPRAVAEIMAKYNLLAVPVVSKAGILEGVVTVDDALDVLLPSDRRRKPPRMY
ncbi:MAG TPA: CBS domain-containing protein [Ktedonobacteraceae bacterium]|nr:CBS domain-containing protein [Ktedonobacteraceae bacterium]